MRYIITIDQRTSSSKALLFDEEFNLIDRKIVLHKNLHPKEGWAEVDAEEIYNNVLQAISQLDLPKENAEFSVSIVNQRETSVIWAPLNSKLYSSLFSIPSVFVVITSFSSENE